MEKSSGYKEIPFDAVKKLMVDALIFAVVNIFFNTFASRILSFLSECIERCISNGKKKIFKRRKIKF